MAIEFGSRKENFDNFKVYETTLAGRPFKVEMGKMCGCPTQAPSSATARPA